MTITARPATRPRGTAAPRIARIAGAVLLLFIFLLGVKGLGDGFKLLSRDLVESFFRATANPFVGLLVGILATTLVQSSSVTTAMIVGLVAAPDNPLPLANAIPMIMGANIGTTVTNTLVSLAHIGRRHEFRRAFAAATCHDFFNYFSVLILLPLELATGFLRRAAEEITAWFLALGTRGVKYESPLEDLLRAGFRPIRSAVMAISTRPQVQATLLIVIAAVLIFSSLWLLVRTMRSLLQARVEMGVMGVLGESGLVGITIGAIVTVMVQSSSITTSLLIPLAGSGIITLQQVFPITIGANIGTTVTALLASLAVAGVNAHAGITIALIHFLFNVIGALMIYPFPPIRRLPLSAARRLAHVASRSRPLAVGHVFGMFYFLPALVAVIDIMWFGD